MYKHIFFDLDGTLSNPRKGVVHSYQYALKKLSIDEPDDEEFDSFIGPSLHKVFSERFDLDEEETNAAISYWREYFGEKGVFENELYDEVEDLLADLVKNGRNVSLVTTKPYVHAVTTVEYFRIRPLFRRIFGSNLDGSMSEKTDLVARALKEHGITDRKSVVMIGDRDLDIIGAKNNDISSIGVLYGFGKKSELENAEAKHLATTVSQLSDILLG